MRSRILGQAVMLALIGALLAVAGAALSIPFTAPATAQVAGTPVVIRGYDPVAGRNQTGNIDGYGGLFARADHPNRFRCTVTVSTATTLTAVGGSCAAPGAGLSLYLTNVKFDASAAGIAADAHPTLKYGTGGTCGSGTTTLWQHLSAAAVTASDRFNPPLKVPANNELCWMSSTAGSKALVLSGFIAP